MIKAIIFDCFGVIYPDTLALVERQYLNPQDILKKNKIRQIRQQADIGLVDRTTFWKEVANIFGITPKELDEVLNTVRGADWELLDYIKTLKQHYKTAMLSNVGPGFIERIFDSKRPQKDYFETVVESGVVGILKPDRRVYQLTADRLSVELPECVMIDDKKEYCEITTAMGVPTICYQDFTQFKSDLESILNHT